KEPLLDGTPSHIATFLDPTSPKAIGSIDFNYRKVIVESVYRRYAIAHEDVSHPTPVSAPAGELSLIDMLNKEILGNVVVPDILAVSEIDGFCRLPPVASGTDILAWWFAQRGQYPILYSMACDYLAVPPASVASERGNSLAERIFDDRETLHSDVFKAEICCNSWLKVIAKFNLCCNPNNVIVLPTDYHNAVITLTSGINPQVDLKKWAETDTVISALDVRDFCSLLALFFSLLMRHGQ
ncbi:hypothetical protein HDU79_007973, partial [Rhizoclosmatium sp. JEL0117]